DVMRLILTVLALAALGACSKAEVPSARMPASSSPTVSDPGAALKPVQQCLEQMRLADSYWQDAVRAASGDEAECGALIMRLRYQGKKVVECKERLAQVPVSPETANRRGELLD